MVVLYCDDFVPKSGVAHGRYSNTERLILCITMVFVCAYKSDWVKKIPKMIVAIGSKCYCNFGIPSK